MALAAANSPFDLFRRLQAEARLRPMPRALAMASAAAGENPLEKAAAIREAEAMARIEKSRHDLYTMKLPLSGLLGTVTYLLWTSLNRNGSIVKDFVSLLQSQQDIVEEINGIYGRSAREGFELPSALKGSLAQLRDTLQAGNAPTDAARYMDEIRRYASGHVQTANLDSALQQYIAATDRIFRNRKGLEALAGEPLVLKLMGVSRKTAQAMARHNREQFMQELLGKVMGGIDLSVFKKVFTRLDHVHFRVARLLAAGVSLGLAGYFIIDNEIKTKRLAKGI